MKVLFIRHGSTPGNLLHQYVGGRTDQHLSEEGAAVLKELKASGMYPEAGLVFISPMIRCSETASIVFPDAEQCVVEGLREMDFGIFEGRSAAEMEDDAVYRSWVDSGCEDPIPEGEIKTDFTQRCSEAFLKTMKELETDSLSENGAREAAGSIKDQPVAFAIHGGTIMAILSVFGFPERSYYDWYVKNGHGFLCEWDGRQLIIEREL